MTYRFFALTTRGLETVSAQEIGLVATVIEVAYRRVAGACTGTLAPLLGLRTVDDVFLEMSRWTDIAHTRDTLARIQDASRKLKLDSTVDAIASLRPIRQKPVFSVTTSFVGRRNYRTNEIKNAVAEGILARYPWTYTGDDRSADLNIRVFIEHDTAFIGVRLGKGPLHERAYKQIQRPGSLKPSVAAAMLLMGDVQAGMQVVDPCCGAGTILIEAAAMGVVARGGDIEREALNAARENATSADVSVQLQRWDARRLPLSDDSVDRVITNLPWGQQISVYAALGQFYAQVCMEIERVLAPGGRTVILTNHPQLLAFRRLSVDGSVEISLFGQTPMIAVFTRQTTRPRSAPGALAE